jgi:hypothetical protein
MEHEIKKALGGKGKKASTHTHGVHYERAGNGGFIAHVHKHHGKGPHSEGHSHTEEHSLPDKEAMAEHLEEQLGDQPAYGEMDAQPEGQDAEAQQPDADPAAAGGM